MVYASNETDWLFTKTVDEVGVAVIAALALTIKVEVNKTKTNKALNIFLIDAPPIILFVYILLRKYMFRQDKTGNRHEHCASLNGTCKTNYRFTCKKSTFLIKYFIR
jgi:hypothetical protein